MVKRRNQYDGLTPKQLRFAQEYVVDFDGTAAAVRAGYSEVGASAAGSRLLAHQKISVAIQRLVAEKCDRTELTADYVLARLRENVERALQRKPVLDTEGKPIGRWTYDGAVANRALELLGKHLGMFGLLVKHDHQHAHEHKHQVIKISELKLSADEKRAIGLQCLEALRRKQNNVITLENTIAQSPQSASAQASENAVAQLENTHQDLVAQSHEKTIAQPSLGPDRSS